MQVKRRGGCIPAFLFCTALTLAYSLSVKLSTLGNAGVNDTHVGTGAPARPGRAKHGKLFADRGRSPA
jgi:hypothetical protein